MNGKDIIDYTVRTEMPDLEELRENCIQKAVENSAVKRGSWVKRIIPAAVCLAVISAAVFAFPNIKSIILGEDNNINKGNKNPSNSEYGVYIPPLELPENSKNASMDMIGLFVYQGKIYTQTAWYYNEDALAIQNLIGEKIGRAKGNIDEWSKQDDYAVEFAGSASGDVYTVKGYDKNFRLCMMGNYTDDNGNHIEWINFYENLNGIGLTIGFDLFGDRIKLRDNWEQVKFQEHDDWDNNKQIFNDFQDVEASEIDAFINALYTSDFEYVHDTDGADKFYSADKKQAHLYFYMNDNTLVELRLFEGGYVGYQHLGWYFVKIPGEAFDVIFNACQ